MEYARTLLLRLEHGSRDIKTQTRKQSFQADLQTKRDLIKRLNQRLIELNQLADDSDSSESEDEDEGVVGVKEFAPAVSTSDTLDINTSSASPSATEDSGLRARKAPTNNNVDSDTAATTALFARSNVTSSSKPPASTDQILDESRREQDLLTSSLVQLAQSLKASSMQFASSLDSEKEILARAEGGLDKNAMGMESAEKRMGTLRRMTEGQGWWGRIKLYAIIAALWVAAFLLVFVGPKFRF